MQHGSACALLSACSKCSLLYGCYLVSMLNNSATKRHVPLPVGMPICVCLVHERNGGVRIVTVTNDVPQAIATEIKSATTSMTSVPKPLKFLRQHYSGLKATCDAMPEGSANKAALADVLSVLAMNSGAEGAREGLKYRLAGSSASVGAWGHEYVRCGDQSDSSPCMGQTDLATVLLSPVLPLTNDMPASEPVGT